MMAKVLTAEAIERYGRDGFCDPIPILSHDEAAAARASLEAFEAENGGPLKGGHRFKSHLLFKWLSDLTRDARVLDPVEDLIGPDLLLWSTDWFVKEASTSPGTRTAAIGGWRRGGWSASGWRYRRRRLPAAACASCPAARNGRTWRMSRPTPTTTC